MGIRRAKIEVRESVIRRFGFPREMRADDECELELGPDGVGAPTFVSPIGTLALVDRLRRFGTGNSAGDRDGS